MSRWIVDVTVTGVAEVHVVADTDEAAMDAAEALIRSHGLAGTFTITAVEANGDLLELPDLPEQAQGQSSRSLMNRWRLTRGS